MRNHYQMEGIPTSIMGAPLWMVELLKKTFPNRRFIAQATKLPIIGKIVDKLLFDGDDIIYLPKDNVVEIKIGQQLERPTETALPSQIVHEFIDSQREHLRKEETLLFPAALRTLQAEDWADIDARMSDRKDPLFDGDVAEKFHNLERTILRWEQEAEQARATAG